MKESAAELDHVPGDATIFRSAALVFAALAMNLDPDSAKLRQTMRAFLTLMQDLPGSRGSV